MNRLSSTLQLDARLQARNGVYLVIAIVTSASALVLGTVFDKEQLRFWMPMLVLGGTTATTVFLVGMLLQVERAQGMLDVLLLSPLRPAEYLASKVLSITTLALIESAILAALAFGSGLEVPWFVIAVLLRASLGVAVGVAIGVRYGSILRWLPPVFLVSAAFDVPNLCYVLDLWSSPFFYLWPTMPSLILAKAAFLPVATPLLVYAHIYGVLAVLGAVFWARSSIERFVVGGEYKL